MQCDATVNDWCERREGGHVRVQFCIAEPHHERLVTNECLVMRFRVGNCLLSMPPILQCEAQIAHVPVDVFLLFEPLNVEVGDGHGQAVVEADSAI